MSTFTQTVIGLVFVRRIFRNLPVGEYELTSVVDMLLQGAAPATDRGPGASSSG